MSGVSTQRLRRCPDDATACVQYGRSRSPSAPRGPSNSPTYLPLKPLVLVHPNNFVSYSGAVVSLRVLGHWARATSTRGRSPSHLE
eukprot:1304879-Prymnesium_polylepis.1